MRWSGRRWSSADHCWSWVMGKWGVILLFSLWTLHLKTSKCPDKILIFGVFFFRPTMQHVGKHEVLTTGLPGKSLQLCFEGKQWLILPLNYIRSDLLFLDINFKDFQEAFPEAKQDKNKSESQPLKTEK